MVGALVLMARRVKKTLSARDAKFVEVDTRQLAMELVAQMKGAPRVLPTFKALADEWLRVNSARLVAPDNEWRHIRHMKSLWEMKEGDLTAAAVQGVMNALVKPSGPLAIATVNKLRATGKKVVDLALASATWVGANPFTLAVRFKQPRRKKSTLTVEQVALVLPHLRADRRRETKASFRLGVRPGELLGLKKAQVDLKRRQILICRSHHRDSTKTSVDREIPIPEDVVEDLRQAMAESPSQFVFPRNDGTGRRQRRDTKLTRTLRTAMVKAGLVAGYRYHCRRKGCGFKEERTELEEGPRCPTCNFKLLAVGIPIPFDYYGLRHSASTELRQAGADALAVKMVLGHAAQDESDDTYTHYTKEFVRMQMNKLSLKEKAPEAATSEANERWMGIEPTTSSLGSLSPSVDTTSADGLSPGVEPGPVLGVADVARLFKCSTDTVYKLAATGKIESVRLGASIRFTHASVVAFIAKGGAR